MPLVHSRRPISATIHLAALRHNLALAKSKAPQSKVMAVIKANGYGHGLLRVAEGLRAAEGFAILSLDEALALRQAGFQQTLLLLEGLFFVHEAMLAAQYELTPVVHNFQQLEMLENAALLKPLEVFLKLNTGMNRLGFVADDFAKAYERLSQCRNVAGITLMTHFATADDALGVAAPLALFRLMTAGLSQPKSLANSAALLRYPETHADWVRPGIMLYGATPVSGIPAASFDLKPAMSLTSEIIAVQNLEVGESVGYGMRFTAAQKTRVGVVACGYADGYPRHAPSGTAIAVAGQMTHTLGRVSMDMLFADLSGITQADIGSPVELWGEQVPVDAVAEASGTVGYELLCALADRVRVKAI